MKIDKLFGDHLAKKGFEYSDSMWSDMDKLIQENQKNTPKKRFQVYLVSGILLTGIVLFFYYLSPNLSKSDGKVQRKAMSRNVTRKGAIASSNVEELNGHRTKNELNSFKYKINNTFSWKQNGNQSSGGIIQHDQINNSIQSDESAQKTIFIVSESTDGLINQSTIDNAKNIDQSEELGEVKPEIKAADKFATIQNTTGAESKPQDTTSVQAAEKENKYPKNKSKWVTYVEATMAIPSAFRKISDIPTGSYRIQENSKKTYTAGFNVAFGRGFYSLGTGLQWQQFTGVNSYSKTQTDWSYNYGYKMINPTFKISNTGNPIALIQKTKDSVGTARMVSLYNNTPYHLQYLNIPLNIGVLHYFGKLMCRAEAGLSAALLIDKGGYYMTTNNQGTPVVEDLKNSDRFKRMVLNQQLSFTMGYAISKRWMLLGKGLVQNTQGSMFSGFNERYQFSMIQFGLGGRF